MAEPVQREKAFALALFILIMKAEVFTAWMAMRPAKWQAVHDGVILEA